MKCFDSQKEIVEAFTIGSGRMPEWERKIFTGSGTKLFCGASGGRQFGCVKNMETGRRDENGRSCYHNIGFEAGEDGGQALAVRKILCYARKHYESFVAEMNRIVVSHDGDYRIQMDQFRRLRKKWEETEPAAEEKLWLVPESSVEYFLKNTGAPFHREDIHVTELEKSVFGSEGSVENRSESAERDNSKEEKGDMRLFFYCSAPSKGYLMKQIDFATGETLRTEKEAARGMSSYGFAILTRGGADLALFRKEKVLCFAAKNIESLTKDHYGRKKYMSVCFEAEGQYEKMLLQLAAWALLDFPAFSREMTDCLEVFDGPEGYHVKMEGVRRLMKRFSRKLYVPEGGTGKEWKKIVRPVKEGEFRYLVLDTSLEYFNRLTKLEVDKSQIFMCVGNARFQQWKQMPLALVFTEELYQPAAGKKAEISPGPEAAEKSKDDERTDKKDRNDRNDRDKQEKTRSVEERRFCEEEDSINLLDSKKFRLLLMAAVLIGAICGIHFFRM